MVENTATFVCPKCMAVNRVPESRLSESPVCGKCKTALLPEHPVELTDANFERFIGRTSVLVVVDFWASWCPPCRMMAPAFAEAAKKLSPDYMLAKLNTEEATRSAAQFDIQGIPCLIAFRHGKEISRQSGAMNIDEIVRWIKNVG